MFTALGILSILAGIFVFRQGSAMSVLSTIASSDSGMTISGAFIIVAVCLVIGGAFSCACKSGEKRGVLKVAIVAYIIAALIGFAFNFGDLKVWSVVCLVIGAIYIIWLVRHKTA